MALAGIKHALQAAHVPKVVLLSSIGAQHAEGTGLILKAYDGEQAIFGLGIAAASIRAAYFMENLKPVLGVARESGKLPSVVEPLDLQLAMIATKDIGELAARLLMEDWSGQRTIELEGPRRYSMNDTAASFSGLLGHPVEAVLVPEGERLGMFEHFGCTPVAAQEMAEMNTGYANGLVAFAGGDGVEPMRGASTLEDVFSSAAAGQGKESSE